MSEIPSLETATSGSIRFNTDSSKLEIYNGEAWWNIDSTSPTEQTGGTRGFFAAGAAPGSSDRIDFVNIASTGDAIDFGDTNTAGLAPGSCADRTRGLISGLYTPSWLDNIDFITMASTGDATDFGNLTVGRAYSASVNNSTRGVQTGGRYPSYSNIMQFITIASTGDATDFGDIPITGIGYVAGASDSHGGLS